MGRAWPGCARPSSWRATAMFLVVTKESVAESKHSLCARRHRRRYGGDQDIALHLEDTVNAGDGLVYRPAAQALVAEGPVRVAELIEWGANFDRAGGAEGGELLRTREGAHSLARILHANGDALEPKSAARWRYLHWRTSASTLPSGPRSPAW